jgi:hypothetical protein
MSLILDGTNGLSDVDGSAATPAIRGTDTNTGIFFPAADTIAFSEGGTEVARFDSSGNLGVGTTSPNGRLHVQNSAGTHTQIWGATGVAGSYAYMRIQRNTSDGTFTFGTAQAGYSDIAFATSPTDEGFVERLRITTGGNLQFNSGYGSAATAYGCRAWVNYSGTGASIRGSGNVSSVVNNGTGDNSINFSTAMPDANFSWAVTQQLNGTGNNDTGASSSARNLGTGSWGTGYVRILTMSNTNASQENPLVLCVQIFR